MGEPHVAEVCGGQGVLVAGTNHQTGLNVLAHRDGLRGADLRPGRTVRAVEGAKIIAFAAQLEPHRSGAYVARRIIEPSARAVAPLEADITVRRHLDGRMHGSRGGTVAEHEPRLGDVVRAGDRIDPRDERHVARGRFGDEIAFVRITAVIDAAAGDAIDAVGDGAGPG